MNLQLFAIRALTTVSLKDGGGSPKKEEEKKKTNTATTSRNENNSYDVNSVVDYLKLQGQDSSYEAREQLAEELGITNYSGKGVQNLQMLDMLKNGTTSNKSDTSKTDKKTDTDITPTVVPVTAPSLTPFAPSANATGAQNSANNALNILTGMATPSVSKELLDRINSQFNASSNLTGAQQNANNALGILTGMSAPSVSADVMQTLNSKFNASSAYLEAMNYTNSLLEKLSSGKTSYTDQIKDMMNQIQNRDKFSYDVNTDALFQQALASAMGSGKQAMQDTMGQASALTGGYASTYAQSAGNQAYNSYIEDAYNNLPEYYQMALEAYNMEGQEMYNQLAMLSDADATEYGRMYDSWNANFSNAQNMYNQEYGAWQDSVNNAYNNANLQLKQQGMAYDQAYNNYTALSNNATNLYNQEYGAWQDSVNNAYNSANLQLKQQGMAYDQAHTNYNALSNQAQTLYQNEYNEWADSVNTALDNYWKGVDKDQKYDMWLAENDLNGDKVVDAKDYEVSKSYSSSSSSNASGDEPKMETLTNRELDTLVNLYLSAETEEAGFEAISNHLAEIGKPNVDFVEIDFAIEEAKANKEQADAEAYEKLPAWEKDWTIVDDTYNGGFLGLPFWQGADHNDTFTDGTNTYTYDQLKKMLKESNLSKEEQKAFLAKLTAQSTK